MIKKIIIGIVLAVVIFFVAASVFVAIYGKKIAQEQIEQNLKLKTSIGSIRLSLPLRVVVNKIQLGELFKAEQISFSPNILGFIAGKIVLADLRIIQPVINLEQSSEGKLNLPGLKQQGKPPAIYITSIEVQNGRFNFLDKKVTPDGLLLMLDKINLSASKVMFPPTSLNVKFKAQADILNQDVQQIGKVSSSGWVDFGPKDMDANFELKDLQVLYFEPYYGEFISKKKLLSANLDLASTLKAKNNDLAIGVDFKLFGLVYAKDEPQQESSLPSFDLVKNTLDLFTDRNGNLDLNFTINTKLDKPEISVKELKKTILQAALNNLSNQPPQDIIEKVSDTIQQFKDFGEKMGDIFKNKQ